MKNTHKRKKRGGIDKEISLGLYHPPFSSNVETSVGKTFIKIVKQSFPNGRPLHKIFNTNTLKLSYSCLPNVKKIIDGHNKKICDDNKKSKMQKTPKKTCNGRKPADCPLNGQCLIRSIIYQATVTTEDDGSKETLHRPNKK